MAFPIGFAAAAMVSVVSALAVTARAMTGLSGPSAWRRMAARVGLAGLMAGALGVCPAVALAAGHPYPDPRGLPLAQAPRALRAAIHGTLGIPALAGSPFQRARL